MKISLCFSFVLGTISASCIAFAQGVPSTMITPKNAETPPGVAVVSAAAPETSGRKQQAHYQLELLYSNYAQNENGLKASGALEGFSLGGEYDIHNSQQMVLWGIEYFTGTPTNDATSSAGVLTSKIADTDFYTFNVSWGTRQTLGESTFSLQESAGAAYRYFESKARGGKTAQQEQIFAYLPLGLGLNWQTSDKWQMRASAEEDILISGSSRQHLENINPAMPTLALSENSGNGTKLSLGARKIGQDLDLTGEVYYRNWQIAQSSTQNYTDTKGNLRTGVTPANSTEMVGLGFGVTY
jgi:hypothetical protein